MRWDHAAGVKGHHQKIGSRRQIEPEMCIPCCCHTPTTSPIPLQIQTHGMSSKEFCSACLTIHAVGIALQASLGEGLRAGTPLRHRVGRRRARWNPAPSYRTMRLDRAKRTAVAIDGYGTPVATAPSRTMSRLQSCVATDSECLLHPRAGEGCNNMLRRSRCVEVRCPCPFRIAMSLQCRSRGKREGQHRWGDEQRASRGAATPPVCYKATPVPRQHRDRIPRLVCVVPTGRP